MLPEDPASTAQRGEVVGATNWADPSYLKEVQYATPANLVARQAIYAYQNPRTSLYDWALDLAELDGDETTLDIGCGNGSYLEALHRRGHRGLIVGMDFSPGMLASARQARGPEAAQPVVLGDAAALAFEDGCADVLLVMHMLYHLPDPRRALAELRRVVRAGGRVLILLNGSAHQQQLRRLLRETVLDFGEPFAGTESVDLDAGEELAATFFNVERHELRAELLVPEPGPVLAYVESMNFLQAGHANGEAMLRSIKARVSERIDTEGAFRITTCCGCLVCR